jgi:hypothetical protein
MLPGYKLGRRSHILEGETMPNALEKIPVRRQATHSGISPLAGKPAPREMLVDLIRLEKEYFDRKPDLENPNQWVTFGTSGHRGASLNGTYTEVRVLAITQAICDYRRTKGTSGPLYMGKDTHGLSAPAQRLMPQLHPSKNKSCRNSRLGL